MHHVFFRSHTALTVTPRLWKDWQRLSGVLLRFYEDGISTLICCRADNNDSLGGFPSDRYIAYTGGACICYLLEE